MRLVYLTTFCGGLTYLEGFVVQHRVDVKAFAFTSLLYSNDGTQV